MDSIGVTVLSVQRDRWAHEQAAAGGDTDFSFSSSSASCKLPWSHTMLSPDTENLRPICGPGSVPRVYRRPLSASTPHLDFEFQVPHETMAEFSSYYATEETFIQFALRVQYNWDSIEKCEEGGAVVTDFIAHTSSVPELSDWACALSSIPEPSPVGRPPSPLIRSKTHFLHARVRITVVGMCRRSQWTIISFQASYPQSSSQRAPT
ncbi:hypothetical protein C8R44DRAFT_200540 [Mycena epipterygia]|nr:hypothetical protein C8R44DRAFT_200540 [Mycena epipterygia]